LHFVYRHVIDPPELSRKEMLPTFHVTTALVAIGAALGLSQPFAQDGALRHLIFRVAPVAAPVLCYLAGRLRPVHAVFGRLRDVAVRVTRRAEFPQALPRGGLQAPFTDLRHDPFSSI
jgi:hypothetical protein